MSRNPIYDQHDKAFTRVSAHVIVKNGERVATVSFKYPADGAGRLQCFLHVLSLSMVRGTASGYGYDKASAAFHDAAKKQALVKLEDWQTPGSYAAEYAMAQAMVDCFRDGYSWQDNLREAGFTVWQAV